MNDNPVNNPDPDILYYLVTIKPPLVRRIVRKRLLTFEECQKVLIKYKKDDREPKRIKKTDPDRIHLKYEGLTIAPILDHVALHVRFEKQYSEGRLKINIIKILLRVFGIDVPPFEVLRLLKMDRFNRECAILSHKIKNNDPAVCNLLKEENPV